MHVDEIRWSRSFETAPTSRLAFNVVLNLGCRALMHACISFHLQVGQRKTVRETEMERGREERKPHREQERESGLAWGCLGFAPGRGLTNVNPMLHPP